MLQPTYNHLRELRKDHPYGAIFVAGAVNVHPNPRFYKYYWWVFTLDSPTEGEEFLTDEHKLSHAAYEQKIADLRRNNGFAMVYNKQLYRVGPDSIWDEEKLKSRNPFVTFAGSFEDDPDPESVTGYR